MMYHDSHVSEFTIQATCRVKSGFAKDVDSSSVLFTVKQHCLNEELDFILYIILVIVEIFIANELGFRFEVSNIHY